MKLSALQRRAAKEGVPESSIDDAIDGDAPKPALVTLLLQRALGGGGGGGGIFSIGQQQKRKQPGQSDRQGKRRRRGRGYYLHAAAKQEQLLAEAREAKATNALQVADEAGHSDDGGDTVAFDSAWTPHARAQVRVVLPSLFGEEADSSDMTGAF